MEEAQAARDLWTTDNFYEKVWTKVGRVVVYDFEKSATLRMINESCQRCDLEHRETLDKESLP